MSAPIKTLLAVFAATLCFHLAHAGLGLGVLIVGFLYCLLLLTSADSFVKLYWPGLLLGLLIYAPQLAFFWHIFGVFAIGLWLVLCVWLLAFLILARWWRRHYNALSLAIVVPFLWTGLEYFRSELYYLRFSWLDAGYAFSGSALMPSLGVLGVYGIGFACMALAALLFILPQKPRLAAGVLLLAAGVIPWPAQPPALSGQEKILHIAGVQLEFPSTPEVLVALENLVAKHPEADVLVLSEYTFDGPVPAEVKNFCRERKKYLIAGGKAPATNRQFYDTAFVVGPTGDIVFSQAKCVPVQFFADGLPALEQRLWYSPWGKIGLGVCYDASYRRVVDELVRQGAQALVFPTMDVVEWGAQEHRLNSFTPLVRAAEYQLPFFRLASSGISEAVNTDGTVHDHTDFPGQGQLLAVTFALPARGRLPLDHWLAPICTAITVGLLWWLAFMTLTRRWQKKRAGQPA